MELRMHPPSQHQGFGGCWRMIDKDKLLGEADSKDCGGAGERPAMQLLSSVWPAGTENDTQSELEKTETT